ncbi:chloride channel protein [Eggerthella hominis]|uniref:chloride channel protein n=1 Tax=Eggerthella hominis TaxID=2763043 RepID=UPI00344CC128
MGAQDGEQAESLQDGRFDLGQLVRHTAFALVVGAAGAAASIVLTLSVDFAGTLSQRHPWLLFALPALGLASIGLYKLLRLPVNLATDGVIERFRANERIPGGVAPGILGGTFLTVLGGGSVGMESGALQMGASIGSVLGRPFKLAPVWRRGRTIPNGYPAALGMAAAFSALFFAPLGSCMFVLELARFDRAVARHVPTMLLATFVAYAIARAVGIGDHIPAVALPALSWGSVAHCLLVGLCCAVGGVLFASGLRALRHVVRHRVGRPLVAVAAGGLLFAALVLAFGWQAFEGTGMGLLRGALAGEAAPADFAVKAVLTVLVLGFGFKGGEIMPMFTVGALLGCTLGLAAGQPAGFSAALGMAAFFAAASRCPLAAVLMGAEIFGWAALPFLLIAVAAAYAGSYDVGVFGRGAASELARVRREARRGESILEEAR